MRTLEPREMTVVSGGVLQKQPHEEGAFGNRLTDWWSKFLGSMQLDAGSGELEEVIVKAKNLGSGGFEGGRIDPASLLASMQLSALTAELGRGGGGGGESPGLGDTIKGYPVDLDSQSIKDAADYAKDWDAVLKTMSPAELNAFDAALENEYKKAMDAFNFGLAEKLLGFKDANGNAVRMGFASSYAAQNMSQVNLGLLEAAITRAYSVAAALPGGI